MSSELDIVDAEEAEFWPARPNALPTNWLPRLQARLTAADTNAKFAEGDPVRLEDVDGEQHSGRVTSVWGNGRWLTLDVFGQRSPWVVDVLRFKVVIDQVRKVLVDATDQTGPTMPSFIVKRVPEEDFYVVWSTVTDSPHYWGTRAELLAGMREGAVPERFDRADSTGTSALWPSTSEPYLGWEDDSLIYEQQGLLPRSALRELCRRLEASPDVDPDVSDLLTPFEDDEDEADR